MIIFIWMCVIFPSKHNLYIVDLKNCHVWSLEGKGFSPPWTRRKTHRSPHLRPGRQVGRQFLGQDSRNGPQCGAVDLPGWRRKRMVEEPYSDQTSTIVQQYMINQWALSCLKHFEPFPVDIRSKGLYHSKWVQNSFQFFFGSGFGFLFWLSFLVPFALYLQQFGTIVESVILHGICMYFATFWHGHFACCTLFATLHLAMFAFHFAWYLPRFGASTSHLHGICYMLVLQTFMWISWEFL